MNSITLAVRPNQKIKFPAICAHCAAPTQQTFPISQQAQLRLRSIAVPLCEQYRRIMRRCSFKESQRLRLGLVFGGGVGVIALAIILLISPVTLTFMARFLLGIIGGAILGTAVWLMFYNNSRNEILPEKQNILQSARIGEFNHQSTTFLFENQTFADRFRQLNQSLQVEN